MASDPKHLHSWANGLDSYDGVLEILDMVSAITKKLSQSYLNQSCIESAVSVITELTDWPAVVLDPRQEVLARSTESSKSLPKELPYFDFSSLVVYEGWICFTIPSSDGYVLCVDVPEGDMAEVKLIVVGEVVALTAFELQLEGAAEQDRARMWGDLAKELLIGADRNQVIAHASTMGYQLDVPHLVGLIADGRIGLTADQVRTALRRASINALVTDWGDFVAVVFGEEAEIDKALESLDFVVPGGHPWMGVSSIQKEGHDLRAAVAEASVALSFGESLRHMRAIRYEDLGVFRLFSQNGRWGQLQEFVHEVLGPLIDYDASHGTDLVHTLDAYLRRDGSLNHLAETLMIHRSTLVYRLARIREVLQFDIDEPSRRLDLSLAARAVEVLKFQSGEMTETQTVKSVS